MGLKLSLKDWLASPLSHVVSIKLRVTIKGPALFTIDSYFVWIQKRFIKNKINFHPNSLLLVPSFYVHNLLISGNTQFGIKTWTIGDLKRLRKEERGMSYSTISSSNRCHIALYINFGEREGRKIILMTKFSFGTNYIHMLLTLLWSFWLLGPYLDSKTTMDMNPKYCTYNWILPYGINLFL